jgi:hypothetical protein
MDASVYYDTNQFVLPIKLQSPERLSSSEVICLAEYLGTINTETPFKFRNKEDIVQRHGDGDKGDENNRSTDVEGTGTEQDESDDDNVGPDAVGSEFEEDATMSMDDNGSRGEDLDVDGEMTAENAERGVAMKEGKVLGEGEDVEKSIDVDDDAEGEMRLREGKVLGDGEDAEKIIGDDEDAEGEKLVKKGRNSGGKGGARKSAKVDEDTEANASSSPRKTRSKTKAKIFEDMPRKTRSKMKMKAIENDANGRASRMTRSSAGIVGVTKRKFTVDLVTQSSKTATKKVGVNFYASTTTDHLSFIQRRVG